MGEVMRLEVVPDDFDVVELWGVFGQPLDGEPVRASREGRERELTDVDRPIVLDQHDRLGGLRWTHSVGQFGGMDKLGSGCCQAANLSLSVAPYASSGVRPASVEWGRRAL